MLEGKHRPVGQLAVNAYAIENLLNDLLKLAVAFCLIAGAVFVGIKLASVQRGTRRRCQFCAEAISRDAIVCRYCGRDIGSFLAL
jgi:hypothetical protein